MKITVSLHKNRNTPGILAAVGDQTLHFACLGRSDQAAAVAHGNPDRDPMRPFGDLPAGSYHGFLTVAADPTNKTDLRSYGPSKRIVLDPVDGPALEAKRNGRWGLMIHGGAPAPTGGFRPTHGCLRLADADMASLIAACVGDPGGIAVSVQVL